MRVGLLLAAQRMTDRRAIQVGDLVMVVRVCCDFPIKEGVRMGLPWRVQLVASLPVAGCPKCGFKERGIFAASNEIKRAGWNCAPVEWLKRIDPPALDENTTTDEPIQEPA